eukprot:11155321-Lingulodinium_polyedra.AAC.1
MTAEQPFTILHLVHRVCHDSGTCVHEVAYCALRPTRQRNVRSRVCILCMASAMTAEDPFMSLRHRPT